MGKKIQLTQPHDEQSLEIIEAKYLILMMMKLVPLYILKQLFML